MSAKLLQVNFSFDIPGDQLVQALAPVAQSYAAVPGLIWKLWLISKEKSEAGGLYLFENEAALQTFLESPLAPKLERSREKSIKQFNIIEDLSKITRGPV
jgi:hypothetical protein